MVGFLFQNRIAFTFTGEPTSRYMFLSGLTLTRSTCFRLPRLLCISFDRAFRDLIFLGMLENVNVLTPSLLRKDRHLLHPLKGLKLTTLLIVCLLFGIRALPPGKKKHALASSEFGLSITEELIRMVLNLEMFASTCQCGHGAHSIGRLG